MKRFVLAAFASGLFGFELRGSTTWVVDLAGGGNFTKIQDAINAAADGDIILVHPGNYGEDLDLSKHVVIRATADPFGIDNVLIHDLGPGSGASLSRFVTTGGNADQDAFAILNCAAPVLIEDAALDFGYELFDPAELLFVVEDCADVAIDGAVTPTGGRAFYPAPVFHFERSHVRCADVDAESADAQYDYVWRNSVDAEPAMEAFDCELVLARTRLRGGNGVDAFYGPSGWGDGTDGGDGLFVQDCVVTILGTEADEIRGGDGGDYYPFTTLIAGDGGDGIHLEGTSTLLISREVAIGGKGGFGSGSSAGKDGDDIDGSGWTRLDLLPHLALTPDLGLGGTATATVDAVELGSVLLLLADQTGFLDPPGHAIGPPWSLVKGVFFQVIGLGRTDGAGDVSVSGSVANDAALVGFVLHLQAAEIADSGTVYLTNAIDRVIRP